MAIDFSKPAISYPEMALKMFTSYEPDDFEAYIQQLIFYPSSTCDLTLPAVPDLEFFKKLDAVDKIDHVTFTVTFGQRDGEYKLLKDPRHVRDIRTVVIDTGRCVATDGDDTRHFSKEAAQKFNAFIEKWIKNDGIPVTAVLTRAAEDGEEAKDASGRPDQQLYRAPYCDSSRKTEPALYEDLEDDYSLAV